MEKQSRAINVLNRVPGGKEIIASSPELSAMKPASDPVKPVTATVVIQPVVPASVDNNKEKDEFDFLESDHGLPEQVEEPKPPVTDAKDVKPEDVLPEDPTGEEQEIDPKVPHGQALKIVRDKYKAAKKEKIQLAAELETTRTKLKEYEDGVALPEVVTKLQQRTSELEKYEKRYNFEASPIYREKFANPIRAEQEKLKALAVDNEVDTDVFNQAMAATSEAEKNRILSAAFKDPLSAIEAKGILKNISKIQAEALEASADAETSLARMMEENDRIETEKRTKAIETVKYNSKDAWTKSLQHLRQDKRFKDIQFEEGNTDHNEKRVRPILTKASQEFGRMLTGMMQHGLTELPEDLGIALANMNILAHTSAAVTIERDSLAARVQELEGILAKVNRVNYPGVNRPVSTVITGEVSKAVGPNNAGRNVLNRVTGGRA